MPGVSLATLETLAHGLGVRTASLLGRRPGNLDSGDRPAAEMLAANLVHMRQQRALTQEDLSQVAGVSRSVIAAIETEARNPALTTLTRLASALETTVERLVSEPKERG